jgi:hypothetical protein
MKRALLFALFYGATLIVVSCTGNGGPFYPSCIAECDTTRWVHETGDHTFEFVRIECTVLDTVWMRDTVEVVVEVPPETVFVEVPSPPDTVYLPWDCSDPSILIGCVHDCLEINGLGHWRECLGECLAAR